jgi:predicted enzyme related to lactoylglutathione lyase
VALTQPPQIYTVVAAECSFRLKGALWSAVEPAPGPDDWRFRWGSRSTRLLRPGEAGAPGAVMARAGDGEAAHWRVDFWIADADAAAARATELGGSVIAGPEDAGPFREAVLADPAAATFSVSQLTAGP